MIEFLETCMFQGRFRSIREENSSRTYARKQQEVSPCTMRFVTE